MECQKCGKEVFLPFRCPYCGDYFCSEHRLPENHECPRVDLARFPKKEETPLKPIPQTPESYEYTVTYIPVESKRKFYFSLKEAKHLAIGAMLVLGIGLSLGFSPAAYAAIGSPLILFVFALLVTASFFIHELAHKFVAQKEGLWAEFRLMFVGIILTAISIISPLFKIISPGAVFIAGFASKKSIGKISIAGPSTNIVLSAVLIVLWLTVNQPILLFAATFNAWIALFNLIPFGILDGFKVFSWNKMIWASAFALSLVFTIMTSFYW
ncbi:MAG: AN1-type zinc finger domain-containing protein [Candidatus Bathyarchaeia archaeon]